MKKGDNKKSVKSHFVRKSNGTNRCYPIVMLEHFQKEILTILQLKEKKNVKVWKKLKGTYEILLKHFVIF